MTLICWGYRHPKDEITIYFSNLNLNNIIFSIKRGTLNIKLCALRLRGYAVGQLVEALRCRMEDRGFDSRWGHFFNRNEYHGYILRVNAAGA
jgi:hypothetical protein